MLAQVAIVTGGGSGIGAALCRELARRGVQVVVADIRAPDAKRVSEEIAAAGGQSESREVDVSDELAMQRLVTETAADHGRLRWARRLYTVLPGLLERELQRRWYRRRSYRVAA